MLAKILCPLTLVLAAAATSLITMNQQDPASPTAPSPHIPEHAKQLVLAGGCFWCIEVIFEELRGVYSVENGYAGGNRPNVTYQQVGTGTTGHAEVIKIFYNAEEVSAEDLLRLFFVVHNPTTLNRQGPDVGTQYRSAIFYATEEEKALAEKILKEIEDEKIWPDKIVTTIEPLRNYTRAEDYHQDYFARFERATPEERSRMNAGYCSAVIEPKVNAFRKKFADRLKKR
jgi:peptide-methionine (S)-S-oxide reductase